MTKKLTLEEFKLKFQKYGAIMLDDIYINNSIKYNIRCKNGHEIKIAFHDFERNGCKICNEIEKKQKAYNELKYKMEKEGYELISSIDAYKTKKTKLKYICSKGHVNTICYDKFINAGRRCPECAGNKPFTFEFVKGFIEEKGYQLLSSEYINVDSELDMMCPNGHKFTTSFYNFRMCNTRCYCEREYKGEKIIRSYLENNLINFEQQKKFDDCKNIRKLSFDFYLPEQNICIEYNGEQHYEAFHFNGSLEDFEKQQENDKIKIDYCKENNIELVTIPYWEFDNIEKILENTLASIL